MTLKSLRGKIDRIDHEILRLLAERLELALETRRFKSCLRDPGREAEVLARVTRLAASFPPIDPGLAARVFGLIMDGSRRLQASRARKVRPDAAVPKSPDDRVAASSNEPGCSGGTPERAPRSPAKAGSPGEHRRRERRPGRPARR